MRGRTYPTDLPARLHYRNGAYYYVKFIDKKSRWLRLGTDKTEAIAEAERLNALDKDTRDRALRAAYRIPEGLQSHIYGRDGMACAYCGSTENLGIDHVIPFSKGGATAPFNLVVACHSCNVKKNDSESPVPALIDMKRLIDAYIERAIDS